MTNPLSSQIKEEDAFGGQNQTIPQRKKLQLKPRSCPLGGGTTRQRRMSSKGDPFGSAVPREDILEKRGVDVKTIDKKFEKKAAPRKYTSSQEKQLEKIRARLTAITLDLRNANEHELPAEAYRLSEAITRKQLNDLMGKYDRENAAETLHPEESRASSKKNCPDDNDYGTVKQAELSSWTSAHGHEEKTDDTAFSNFFSNRRRRPARPQQQA